MSKKIASVKCKYKERQESGRLLMQEKRSVVEREEKYDFINGMVFGCILEKNFHEKYLEENSYRSVLF